MKKAEFRQILTDHFIPIVPGASVDRTVASRASHSLVAYENPCSLLLKPTESEIYRLRLVRSQPFSAQEKKLAEIFINELSEISEHSDEGFFAELMNSLPRRVISQLLPARTGRVTLAKNLQAIESLASQTYEGRPIVCAFGTTGSVGYGPIHFDELWKEDFSRVISNAFDTIYVGGSDGKVFGVESLDNFKTRLLCPYRFSRIASWCNRPNRVAITLNRNGEILVFQNERLQFAKRRGEWRFYSHDSVLRRLGRGLRNNIRHAVYESSLDVSFGRTGGCIAVLDTRGIHKLGMMVSPNDLLREERSTKTKLLNVAIRKPFQNLDRRVRQELMAMDGATVIGPDGTILAIGAIVKLPGGSTGGGRKAAAIQLSKLGLGIKISSDGPITGYRRKAEIFSL